MLVGPWSHIGMLDNRVGHTRSGNFSAFDLHGYALDFARRCCAARALSAAAPSPNRDPNPTTCSTPAAAEGAVCNSPARDGNTGAENAAAEQHPLAEAQAAPAGGAAGEAAVGLSDMAPPADGMPVHFYVMGHRPRWEAAVRWPPPGVAAEPLRLFLAADTLGQSPELAHTRGASAAAGAQAHLQQCFGSPKGSAPIVSGDAAGGVASPAGAERSGAPCVPGSPAMDRAEIGCGGACEAALTIADPTAVGSGRRAGSTAEVRIPDFKGDVQSMSPSGILSHCRYAQCRLPSIALLWFVQLGRKPGGHHQSCQPSAVVFWTKQPSRATTCWVHCMLVSGSWSL